MIEAEDLSELQSMFAIENITVGDIAAGHRSDLVKIAKLDRLTTVSTFASMLASPRLQANAYRIEALVHIAVANSAGRQYPTSECIRKIFKRFGKGICGRIEDPS